MGVVIDQVAVFVIGGLRILEDLVVDLVLSGVSANLTQDDGDGVVFGATVAQLAELLLDLGKP